tara:strand:+ start:1071 stop:1178 length:108 start_codon:yes stop_codon:yes gene_type:complete
MENRAKTETIIKYIVVLFIAFCAIVAIINQVEKTF